MKRKRNSRFCVNPVSVTAHKRTHTHTHLRTYIHTRRSARISLKSGHKSTVFPICACISPTHKHRKGNNAKRIDEKKLPEKWKTFPVRGSKQRLCAYLASEKIKEWDGFRIVCPCVIDGFSFLCSFFSHCFTNKDGKTSFRGRASSYCLMNKHKTRARLQSGANKTHWTLIKWLNV